MICNPPERDIAQQTIFRVRLEAVYDLSLFGILFKAMSPHSVASLDRCSGVFLLELVCFASQATLLYFIFSKDAHACQDALLQADEVVLVCLLMIMSFNMSHHKDRETLLN